MVGIPYNCTEDTIRQVFEKYGRVGEVFIPYKKGYAFLSMENIAQCKDAMSAINGAMYRITPDSPALSIAFAKSKDSGSSKYNKRY